MLRILLYCRGFAAILLLSVVIPAMASSFRVQCPGLGGTPTYTNLHPNPTAPSTLSAIAAAGSGATYASVFPGQIKCQEIAGGDGFATMADGTQIYLFGFGPLSGRALLDQGLPGTQTAAAFNLDVSTNLNGSASEPAAIMNLGVLSAQQPAPMMAIDEDDEYFLTLSNVGQIMRPDLFEQHTVHFHGYPNASSFFDGVPDASIAINISGSFTYYYTAPDAGTYFFHCHIAPPEHLQMGMVGQLYVRPRQNRLPVGADLKSALIAANLKAARPVPGYNPDAWNGMMCSDILCTGQTPVPANSAVRGAVTVKYAYNDGDGSTRYDVEYPIQLMGFDPNFHYVGMTFNPEAFADMKDKYFMISGRGYPDTINTNVTNTGIDAKGMAVPNGPIYTMSSDGASRSSQPVPTLINIPSGGRALLRISDLNVTEFHTLATVGIPMLVIGNNARLLRDMAGNNLYYQTNSVTLGGGESVDVILDAATVSPGTYFLYSTNLDHLSNDAENFGGMMTEIVVN